MNKIKNIILIISISIIMLTACNKVEGESFEDIIIYDDKSQNEETSTDTLESSINISDDKSTNSTIESKPDISHSNEDDLGNKKIKNLNIMNFSVKGNINSALLKIKATSEASKEDVISAIAGYGDKPPWRQINEIVNIERIDYDILNEYFICIPKYIGSKITVYNLDADERGNLVVKNTAYTKENTPDDYALIIKTISPEGMPFQKVVIEYKNEYSERYLSYDGKGDGPYVNDKSYYNYYGDESDNFNPIYFSFSTYYDREHQEQIDDRFIYSLALNLSPEEHQISDGEIITLKYRGFSTTIEGDIINSGNVKEFSGFDEKKLIQIDNEEWGISKDAKLYMEKNTDGAQFIYIYGDERLIFTIVGDESINYEQEAKDFHMTSIVTSYISEMVFISVEEVRSMPSLWE